MRFFHADEKKLSLQVPNAFFQEYLREHYSPVIEESCSGARSAATRSSSWCSRAPRRWQRWRNPRRRRRLLRITSDAPPPQESGLIPGIASIPSCRTLQPICTRRLRRSRRPSGQHVQPALSLRRVGTRQDPPPALDRRAHPGEKPAAQDSLPDQRRLRERVINAIRYERVESFHKKYREECDVLLVDDIQFIAGKDRSQTEFFHTFNALHGAKRQIVVTSDKMPHEIPNLELRLKSRLQWGLIADIQPPEMETRVAILKRKADALGKTLPDDVAIYVATQISTNIRELEGALTRLFAFATSKGRPLALELVRESMRGLEQGAPLQLSVEAVQRAACSFYDVKLADLKGTRRSKEIITPRQVAMYLARKLTGASYPEIGARFQKDHATVINAVTKIERLLLSDLQLKHAVDSLTQSLQQGR